MRSQNVCACIGTGLQYGYPVGRLSQRAFPRSANWASNFDIRVWDCGERLVGLLEL